MLLILGILFFIIVLELLLRKGYDRTAATKHHGPTHYPWSFVTPSGESVSRLQGDLRLTTHPFTVYSNAPNQKDPRFRINERGLRTDAHSFPADRSKGQKTVLILGGSAAFGTGLNSNQEYS